ncbi:hypothetical protein C8R44DRAFT_732886 [Mycena epipterygia]|nr:hypothetical protein C8R44DRAFT_732886 [Mycena epipterygia]
MSLAPKENSNVSGIEFGWFGIKDSSEKGIEGRKCWRTYQAGVCPIEKTLAKSQTHSVDGRTLWTWSNEPRKSSKDEELAEKELGQLYGRRKRQENDGRSPSADGARAITLTRTSLSVEKRYEPSLEVPFHPQPQTRTFQEVLPH